LGLLKNQVEHSVLIEYFIYFFKYKIRVHF
jgi:hypothetical protein